MIPGYKSFRCCKADNSEMDSFLPSTLTLHRIWPESSGGVPGSARAYRGTGGMISGSGNGNDCGTERERCVCVYV